MGKKLGADMRIDEDMSPRAAAEMVAVTMYQLARQAGDASRFTQRIKFSGDTFSVDWSESD